MAEKAPWEALFERLDRIAEALEEGNRVAERSNRAAALAQRTHLFQRILEPDQEQLFLPGLLWKRYYSASSASEAAGDEFGKLVGLQRTYEYLVFYHSQESLLEGVMAVNMEDWIQDLMQEQIFREIHAAEGPLYPNFALWVNSILLRAADRTEGDEAEEHGSTLRQLALSLTAEILAGEYLAELLEGDELAAFERIVGRHGELPAEKEELKAWLLEEPRTLISYIEEAVVTESESA